MNTPAHVALNLLVLFRKDRPGTAWPVITGSLAPDAPIIVFYLWARLWRKLPETEIWTRAYDQPAWQAVFDAGHSIPIALAACIVFVSARRSGTAFFFAGMALHAMGDFLLHHDDAHRHLFPLSDWRFHSPVSYWDPAHYGTFFSGLEILAVTFSAWVLARRFPDRKGWVAALVAVYGGYWLYAAMVWMR